jgi:hypothetical protein
VALRGPLLRVDSLARPLQLDLSDGPSAGADGKSGRTPSLLTLLWPWAISFICCRPAMPRSSCSTGDSCSGSPWVAPALSIRIKIFTVVEPGPARECRRVVIAVMWSAHRVGSGAARPRPMGNGSPVAYKYRLCASQ